MNQKQCPNCKSYNVMGGGSFTGLVGITSGSCFGCLGLIIFPLLIPALVFVLAGIVYAFYDLYLCIAKKPRKFYCQNCKKIFTI